MSYRFNHYVTRFLTEPWEFRNGTKREIWYYDFKKEKILHRSSQKLFSNQHVFTEEVELRFNRLIETPFARFRESLITGQQLENSDWEVQRALHLMFLAQPDRVAQARDPHQNRGLSEFLDKEAAFLDSLVLIQMNTSNLVRVRVPSVQVLFYPDIGVFAIPYQDPGCATQWSTAMGIPITPNVALVKVSKTVTNSQINEMPIWNCSVGLDDHVSRIAIPAHAVQHVPHNKIIDNIKFARDSSRELFQLMFKARRLVETIYNKMGLVLEKIPGSMHGTLVAKQPRI